MVRNGSINYALGLIGFTRGDHGQNKEPKECKCHTYVRVTSF